MKLSLSRNEAAAAISCSVRKFMGMVEAGTMPPPRQLVDRPRNGVRSVKQVWLVSEVQNCLEALPRAGEAVRDELAFLDENTCEIR